MRPLRTSLWSIYSSWRMRSFTCIFHQKWSFFNENNTNSQEALAESEKNRKERGTVLFLDFPEGGRVSDSFMFPRLFSESKCRAVGRRRSSWSLQTSKYIQNGNGYEGKDSQKRKRKEQLGSFDQRRLPSTISVRMTNAEAMVIHHPPTERRTRNTTGHDKLILNWNQSFIVFRRHRFTAL